MEEQSFTSTKMHFDGVYVFTGITSFLCLVVGVIFFYFIKRTNSISKDKSSSRPSIKEIHYDAVNELGFTIVAVPCGEQSSCAAIADQLVISGIDKNATVSSVLSKTSSSVSVSSLSRHLWRRKKEIEHDKTIHAIANAYNLIVEVINVDTLESRIIRPKMYVSGTRKPMQTIFIGFIGQDQFVSLHKSVVTNRRTPVKLQHEHSDGCKTNIDIPDQLQTTINIGDMNTQLIDCGDEYQKHTTISIGKNNVKHISCKLRTPKEIFECAKHFHERQAEFEGATVQMKIFCGDDNDKYETMCVETLKSHLNEFQKEVDPVLDVEIKSIQKECILVVFTSRSKDSALQVPFRFFSKRFECLLHFILRSAAGDANLPNAVEVLLEMKFQEHKQMPQSVSDYCLATIQTGGFSISVGPKNHDCESDLCLENISENLAKAALNTLDTQGILKPNTEVELTLKDIACKCRSEEKIEIQPLSSQKGQGKWRGRRNTQAYDHMFEQLDFLEVGKMTGVLKGNNGLTATAFRAGNNHVITALHVFKVSDPDQIEVFFKDENKVSKVKLVYICEVLDVALLKILSPSKRDDSVLYISEVSPGDDIYIVGNSSKKNLQKERTTCLNWRISEVFPECNYYISFHSDKLGEGSSGAPCLKIREEKLCVVSVVIGQIIGKEKTFVGVNMMILYLILRQENQELCHEIFRLVDTDTSFAVCKRCETNMRCIGSL